MKTHTTHILSGVFLLLLLVTALSIPFFEQNRFQFQDGYFRVRMFYNECFREDYPKESAAVLIDIDDETMFKTKEVILNKPELLAKIIENVSKYEPKLIVSDIWFTYRDNKVLAEAVKNAGNVLLAYSSKDVELGYIDSSILNASTGYGPANFAIIIKGVARNFTYVTEEESGKQLIPIPIIAALMYNDLPVEKLEAKRYHKKVVLTSRNKIVMALPFDKGKYPLINYLYDEENTTIIPAWKVLEGDIPKELLKGKITLLTTMGSTSVEDKHLTPLGKMAGSMVFLNLINMFVYSEFLREIPLIAHFIIFFLITLIMGMLFYRTTLLKGLAILIFTICASLAISFTLFLHNIVWSAFDIIALVLLLYVGILFHKALVWEIEKRP